MLYICDTISLITKRHFYMNTKLDHSKTDLILSFIKNNDVTAFEKIIYEKQDLFFLNNTVNVKITLDEQEFNIPRTLMDIIAADRLKHPFIDALVLKFGESLDKLSLGKYLEAHGYDEPLTIMQMTMYQFGVQGFDLTAEIDKHLIHSKDRVRNYEFYIAGLTCTCKNEMLKSLFMNNKDLVIENEELVTDMIELEDEGLGYWAIANNTITSETALKLLLDTFYKTFKDVTPLDVTDGIPQKYMHINLSLLV